MKAVVLPLALIGALAVGTAYAAGGSSSSMGGPSGSSSSTQQSQQHWSKSEVKQIQSKLKQQGYDVGQVDGRLGPSTQQALRQFQEDKGIQATGQPDQQTLAALNVQRGAVQQGQVPESSGRSRSGGPSGGSSGYESGGQQQQQQGQPGSNR